MAERIAGTISVTYNGDTLKIASEGIDYHTGKPKREALSGPDDPFQGYKETQVAPYVSGTGRVVRGFSVSNFTDLIDVTVNVDLANGTTLGFFEAMYTGDGVANSGNGEIEFHFTARTATEIPA
jgi:hypothetical protein